jgi:hypothetical protein
LNLIQYNHCLPTSYLDSRISVSLKFILILCFPYNNTMSEIKDDMEKTGDKMKTGAKKTENRMEEGAEEAKEKVE